MFNVINSSQMKNLKAVQGFSRTPENKDNKLFFKNLGQNEF